MKPFLRHSLLLLIAAAAFAPAKAQLKLGDNPTSINKDAILELNSDHQGLLFPRVLKAQIVAGGGLFGAVDGLVVYVTDESCLYLKKAGIWTKLGDNISAGTGIAISPLGVIDNTGVLQFNGRTGNVTPASGDYNLNQLGDVALGALTTGDVLYYNGTKWTNWTPDLAQLGAWSVNGNNITTGKFFGTTNAADIIFKTNNAERGRFLSDGRLELGGVDYTNAQYLTANLMIKNRMIIEGSGTGSNNELIFTKASGGGVMRIADDQNDFQIQGGNALNLAIGANKGIVLSGDINSGTALSTSSTTGTGVLIPAQRDASVPLGIQAKSATQTANLTEWRDATGNVLSIFDKAGNLGLGTTTAARTLHVQGTMRLTGDVAGATATGLMGRDANGDVTTVTPPAVVPANPIPTWSLAANVLNINNTAALWNANKIQGIAVPAPSGTNSYLKYDGTNLSWATASSGSTLPGNVNNSVLVTGSGAPYWAQAPATGVSLLVSGGSNPYWATANSGGLLLASSGGSSIYWSNAPTGAGALVSSNGNPSWAGTTSNGLLMSNGTSAYWGGTSNTAVLTTGGTGVMSWQSAPSGNSILYSNGTSVYWQAANFMNNSLGNGQMWVGNNTGVATAVTMSGDASLSNTGALQINSGAVTGGKIAQMSATLNQVLAWNGTTWAPTTAAASGVTSVGLSMPNIFTVTNSPVTGTGTLTASLATQAANTVFAGPVSGGNAAPVFRALTAADIPTLGGYIQNQFTAAQATSNFWISGNGKTGGTMEVGGTSGSTTGLKFTGINSSTTPAVANNVMLTLDASGNVILAKNPATANWLTTGNSSPGANTFLGTITDDLMNIRSSNLPFLTFGKRGLIAGLTQSYPGYQDALEKVTYIQSALQFQADAASFYKPKMWTDSLGNFHMMGPMAGTDYFEFAAGGKDNAGEFDITSGDDGDEPIVFRNYFFSNGVTTEWARVQKGKFGINTPGTEPARTLHVNGDMRLVNDASGANAANVLAKDNNGDVTSVAGSSNGQVLQYDGAQWQAGPQMLHYTNIAIPGSGNLSHGGVYSSTIDLSSKLGSTVINTGATILVTFRSAITDGMVFAWVIRNADKKITIGIVNAKNNTDKFDANTFDLTIIQ